MPAQTQADEFHDKLTDLLDKLMKLSKDKLIIGYTLINQGQRHDTIYRNMYVHDDVSNKEVIDFGSNMMNLSIEDVEADLFGEEEGLDINFKPEV